MKKKQKKDILFKCAVVLVLLVFIGLVTATFILKDEKKQDWTYSIDSQETDYYRTDDNEYSFLCVSAFKEALMSYLGKQTLIKEYLTVDSTVKDFCNKIVRAFSIARVPAEKLQAIADVMNDNSLSKLLDDYIDTVNGFGSFKSWAENAATNLSQIDLITVCAGFVNSFLTLTTLTENEFSRILYHYLNTYASEEYKKTLRLYDMSYVLSLFSDTFFALRLLGNTDTSANDGFFKTNAIRSALYELSSLYCRTDEISDKNAFDKLLGLPERIPDELGKEMKDEIDYYYSDCFGSVGKLFFLIGTVLRNFSEKTLNDFSEYNLYVNAEKEDIDRLQKKLANTSITEEETVLLVEKLKILNAKKIVYALDIASVTKKSLDEICVIKKDEYEEPSDILEYFSDSIYDLREVVYFISDKDSVSKENAKKMIRDSFDRFSSALSFLSEFDYTYDEILAMDTSSTKYSQLIESAENINAFRDILSLYFNSQFSILLTYGLYTKGLL